MKARKRETQHKRHRRMPRAIKCSAAQTRHCHSCTGLGEGMGGARREQTLSAGVHPIPWSLTQPNSARPGGCGYLFRSFAIPFQTLDVFCQVCWRLECRADIQKYTWNKPIVQWRKPGLKVLHQLPYWFCMVAETGLLCFVARVVCFLLNWIGSGFKRQQGLLQTILSGLQFQFGLWASAEILILLASKAISFTLTYCILRFVLSEKNPPQEGQDSPNLKTRWSWRMHLLPSGRGRGHCGFSTCSTKPSSERCYWNMAQFLTWLWLRDEDLPRRCKSCLEDFTMPLSHSAKALTFLSCSKLQEQGKGKLFY